MTCHVGAVSPEFLPVPNGIGCVLIVVAFLFLQSGSVAGEAAA